MCIHSTTERRRGADEPYPEDLTRSMLKYKNVADEFWAEAVVTAAYIRNRVTSRSLPKNKTPFDLWFGKPPNISHLRVFGSKCWYKINQPHQSSLDNRACEAIMLGYATNRKAYKLWDSGKGEVVVSRDVLFDETSAARGFSQEHAQFEYPDAQLDDDTTDTFNPETGDTDEHTDQESDAASAVDEPSPDYNLPGSVEDPASFEDGPLPRRSSRQRKTPGEWWKAAALSSVVPEHQLTFAAATKGGGIKVLEGCYTDGGRCFG